jgi:hypothetical protein
MPTSWKQNLPGLVALPPLLGCVPAGHAPLVSATACDTKIWNRESPATLAFAGLPVGTAWLPLSASCQVIHGAGFAPALVVPPISDGSVASRLVLMFSD